MHPWRTPFPIWNQSVVPCPVLTVAPWPAYRSVRRKFRWSGIPISLRIFQFFVIHRVFGIVIKAEVDVYLELSCFFDDTVDVGNLISGSSAFSKSSLNIWKFMVCVLMRLGSFTFVTCLNYLSLCTELWNIEVISTTNITMVGSWCLKAGNRMKIYFVGNFMCLARLKGSVNEQVWRLIPIFLHSFYIMHRYHTTYLEAFECGILQFSSVQSSHSVMSDSLQPHEPQHARPPRLSPTLRACSNSCPLSQWCHPTISSSIVPFSSCLQSFPTSGSFPMSQLIASGGQHIGVSASTTVFPMNTQDWLPLGWTGWIFLQSKGLSRVISNTTVQKHEFFSTQLSLESNSHIHTWLLEKP